ncbi:MAG: hypothetical protein JNM96_02175 [Bacteroidia bacterium]|nr:hypothetical protein [Bacteroidia bacterium]
MKSATIHHLNSGLIIISCLVAFFVPFELFLFSYGVLGPLHYLTEIGWLHKKNYFTKGKYDFIFLGIACVILVYYNFNPPKRGGDLITDIITFSLFASGVFVFIKDWLYRIILLILALVSIGFINNIDNYFIWFGIFLPTIIHVFIFTWLFMLYGVLKERSWPGFISIVVLIICASTFFIFQPGNLNYVVSEYVQKSYNLFAELNFRLIELFNIQPINDFKEIYTTNSGFVIMRFIAFAYTYHYLNWFSKTSVIKWHQVPKNVLIGTLVIWVISVALYAIDYNKGLKVLFFLSFLHVFLEFPLNFVSITGIGKELFGLTKAKA